MESIKRFSKKKSYSVFFYDVDGNPCGQVEDVTNIENKYGINNYALKVCTRLPRKVVVRTSDCTEESSWSLSLDWYNKIY